MMDDSPTGTGKLKGSRNTGSLMRLAAFLMMLGVGLGYLLHAGFDLKSLMQDIENTDPLYFLAAMCLLPLAGFPISAFYLFAGSAFEWWQAVILCSTALAVNMTLASFLAGSLLKAPVTHFLAKYQRQLPTLTEKNQFRITFLVRSIPGEPFFMQNYMLPLLGIRFSSYLAISWSVQTVFAAGMAALPHLVRHSGWVPAGMVAGLVLLLLLFKRMYLRDHPPRIQ